LWDVETERELLLQEGHFEQVFFLQLFSTSHLNLNKITKNKRYIPFHSMLMVLWSQQGLLRFSSFSLTIFFN